MLRRWSSVLTDRQLLGAYPLQQVSTPGSVINDDDFGDVFGFITHHQSIHLVHVFQACHPALFCVLTAATVPRAEPEHRSDPRPHCLAARTAIDS